MGEMGCDVWGKWECRMWEQWECERPCLYTGVRMLHDCISITGGASGTSMASERQKKLSRRTTSRERSYSIAGKEHSYR